MGAMPNWPFPISVSLSPSPVLIRHRASDTGMTVATARVSSFGLRTPSIRSSAALPIRPDFTATVQTSAWAGRKDLANSSHRIGGGGGAAAPKAMVNEMIVRSILAVPENSGPHRCR